jgi:hypothetical protein
MKNPILRSEVSDVEFSSGFLGLSGKKILIYQWGKAKHKRTNMSPDSIPLAKLSNSESMPGFSEFRINQNGGLIWITTTTDYYIDSAILNGQDSGKIVIDKVTSSFSTNDHQTFTLDCKSR